MAACALFHRLRAFRDDRRGAIAIVSAAVIVVTVGLAAFAVDIGSYNLARRQAQSSADFAAMAGAADLAHATNAAQRSLNENMSGPLDTVKVATGIYDGRPGKAVGNRFAADATSAANAVKVDVETRAPLYFGRLLTGDSERGIKVSATAAVSRMATFAVGSRLVRVDGGVLNGLLSALTGSSISLTAMDYQALADARVSLFGTLTDLGTEVGVRAGTYDDVLKVSSGSGALARAIANQTSDTRSRSALRVIATAGDTTAKVALGRLVDVGPYAASTLGEKPAVDVTVSALDLMMAQLQLANGGRILDTALNLSLPGIATVSLKLAIGERPVGSPWLAIGAENVAVHTAQTRLLLDVKLLGGPGILNLAQVRLPVYVEAAPSDARLTKIVCGASPSDLKVTVEVRPGVLDAWIADVTPQLFANTSQPLTNLAPVELVRLPLVKVTGRAHAAIRNTNYTSVDFRQADIDRKTPKTVKTSTFTTSLTDSLIRDLDLQASLLGLPLIDLGLVKTAVANLLATVTPTVDQLLVNVLETLGVGLGEADVWVLGTRCDGAVLVQ